MHTQFPPLVTDYGPAPACFRFWDVKIESIHPQRWGPSAIHSSRSIGPENLRPVTELQSRPLLAFQVHTCPSKVSLHLNGAHHAAMALVLNPFLALPRILVRGGPWFCQGIVTGSIEGAVQ